MTEKHNRGHLAMSRHKVILSCCTNMGRPRSLTHIFANEFTAAANDINCGKGHHSLMAPPSYSVCGYGKKQRAKGKNAAGHFYYLGKTQLIFLQANKTGWFKTLLPSSENRPQNVLAHPIKCPGTQFFSQPFTRPGRNVFTLCSVDQI